MPDPTTGNRLLAVPSHGSDVNQWDVPVNGNTQALDGMFGGVTTIALSSATTTLLTVPATGSVSAGAGPNQSQNALIKFSGALTGNQVVQFTLPGFYIVHNLTSGNFFVQLQPAAGTGSGNAVGAPPGRKIHVFYDGTSMDYVNMPEVGSFMDLAVGTTPPWMNACTVQPWLVCDGSVYNQTNFTALCAYLGSTFGGNGITTFGVPDLRARNRIPLDNQGSQGAAGRVTAAVSGVNGTTWGASGGSQALQAHNHAAAGSDSGHTHTLIGGATFMGFNGSPIASNLQNGGTVPVSNNGSTAVGFANISVAVASTGAGGSQNMQPTLVHGLTYIKS